MSFDKVGIKVLYFGNALTVAQVVVSENLVGQRTINITALDTKPRSKPASISNDKPYMIVYDERALLCENIEKVSCLAHTYGMNGAEFEKRFNVRGVQTGRFSSKTKQLEQRDIVGKRVARLRQKWNRRKLNGKDGG